MTLGSDSRRNRLTRGTGTLNLALEYPSGFKDRWKCRICSVSMIVRSETDSFSVPPPRQTNENLLSIDSTIIGIYLYRGRRLMRVTRGRRAMIGALRSKNSGIQACLILVSLKGQACLGELCAGAVCRRREKWKKGSSILETQEVYVERCT